MEFKNNQIISVIVPCFNSGKTLRRTIQSIKNQTWKNKEIIVVNDGSNDKKTLKILEGFKDDKLLKIINQKNKGLSAARNNGVLNSKGSYLFFLDADDWIESNALSDLYIHLLANQKFAYTFSDCFLEGEASGIREKEFNFFEQMFTNQVPYSILIPRQIIFDIGLYDEKMKLGYEDWELNIRLGSKNFFGKRLKKSLFHYSVSNSGMLISRSIKNHIFIWNYIKNKNPNLYRNKSVFSIFFQWCFKKSNYPMGLVFLWYLILNFFPHVITLRIFLPLRKIKSFFRKSFLPK
tara:strand:- start:456 stop:1331 length:876 start_codon:yes stop_codon:yes gene_type:complete